jgi:hypothetical protein
MAIDQRNAGASVTPTTNATYTLDRWNCLLSVSSKFSTQQSSIAPPGFSSSNLITSLSSYSSSSGDYFSFRQQIEGFNTSDLGWGTAEASPVTLSFWVRSSLTGSFGGSIISTGASNYSYPFLYTINSANTWEQISVSVPANTFNAPNAGNASALEICFDLGTGSGYSGTAGAWANSYAISATGATSVVGTSGATFYITGVQLEAGSVATEFEHRPYGMELSLCQRYHYQINSTNTAREFLGLCFGYDSDDGFGTFYLPVSMRGSISLSANDIALWLGATVDTNTISFVLHRQPHVGSTAIGINIDNTGSPSIGTRDCLGYGFNNTSAGYLKIESEL